MVGRTGLGAECLPSEGMRFLAIISQVTPRSCLLTTAQITGRRRGLWLQVAAVHLLLPREAGQGAEPECKAGVGLSLWLGSGFCPAPVLGLSL